MPEENVEEDLYRVDAFQLFDFKDATHNHPRAVRTPRTAPAAAVGCGLGRTGGAHESTTRAVAAGDLSIVGLVMPIGRRVTA